ncbi:sensor histidine kinase [Paenibacillus lutrae]|uniref:histidine kinase n=1 Tax=Paenibacillus lutrae TaxID=2078573 RepID=A0A7X3FLG8_9BACL|nr:sensor histidine kinase [Paenibacillus lutrae]MVP01901.1 sensor histidine kinase [Paenibacillus lutrae]
MRKWFQVFQKKTGLSPYVWVVFFILPFYFILSSSMTEIIIGITLIIVFFVSYVLSVMTRGWQVYFWTSVQIIISIAMTVLFGYLYFSLFLAFFIGNIQNKIGFITFYTIHLVSTIVSINLGFVAKNPVFITQLPFVLISLIGVILLPVNTYNKNKQEKLEGQLQDANKRISDLVKLEERQRIARDLHDTLGQKLSLIGLKSDLANKLMSKNPNQARAEINDVRQTARSALKEVREMVTEMRGARVEDEVGRVRQILQAAEIDFHLEGDPRLTETSLITENVISMCLKEAVTNIVKHSRASSCTVEIEPSHTELIVRVRDNGVGISTPIDYSRGNGIRGMKERLEFVNGSLEVTSSQGTNVIIKVPNVFKTVVKEAQV